MRLVFAGTPQFARSALAQLHAAGHDIALVLTQPDRPAGRGMKMQASPVKQFALDRHFAIAQPHSLRLDGKFSDEARTAQRAIAQAHAQAMVVVAYGLLLPQWVLDAFSGYGQWGCFNIHASLLPRWRGAAPIHRAIEAGDLQTGVTIMQMDAGLDTGPMLLQESMAIAPTETTATLHDPLAALGARLMVQALENPSALVHQAQDDAGACYARKIEKSEAAIDWQQEAPTIARKVRAFDPFPGASTVLAGETIKVWSAHVADDPALPGAEGLAPRPGQVLRVSKEGLLVAAGFNTCVCITQLQRPGGKRLAVADYLQGHPIAPGSCFDSPPPVGLP